MGPDTFSRMFVSVKNLYFRCNIQSRGSSRKIPNRSGTPKKTLHNYHSMEPYNDKILSSTQCQPWLNSTIKFEGRNFTYVYNFLHMQIVVTFHWANSLGSLQSYFCTWFLGSGLSKWYVSSRIYCTLICRSIDYKEELYSTITIRRVLLYH